MSFGKGANNILRALSRMRVRLVLGYFVAFFGMALFGFISYRYFHSMEEKLYFLSHADAMLDSVLEMRRYEKNYLLYRHEEDYQQTLAYLREFEGLLTQGRDHIRASIGHKNFSECLTQAEIYVGRFRELHREYTSKEATGIDRDVVLASMRAAGKWLVDQSESMALKERMQIQKFLQQYRPVLLAFLVTLGAAGALVAWSLISRVVVPLQTVEEATKIVADGEYKVIPWPDRHDEIGALVLGFNQMVVQLKQNSEQMIQTEKLSALGTLTSGVAHELNNPLNNISTSCQILMEETKDVLGPYHQELLQAIEGQVTQARDIVSSLLEFSRQREFELRREDLGFVISEALKLIKGEIPNHIRLQMDVPEGIVLEMDKAHMVQAFINLIMNGIQAMEKGGTLKISAKENGARAEIRVEDSGTGIPPQIMPRIFDPFFTTKDVGQGTGLGLSITYGIIERHEGHIHAENLSSGGARFTIHLPLGMEKGANGVV